MSVSPGNYAFYIGRQAAKGTEATMSATACFYLERIDGDLMVDKEWAKLQTGGTAGWSGGRSYLNGVKMTSDTLTVVASPNITGAAFTFVLGADAISGAAAPYTHAITPAATAPWVTVWRQVDNEWTRFVDCKVSMCAFESANDGDEIIARLGLKIVPCALPVHLVAAPSNLPTKESAAYTFWMGEGAWLIDAGAGIEANKASISRFRVAAERPTSTPKGQTFLPVDAFFGVGNIEVGMDILADDHTIEFIHLFGAANPADGAAMSTAITDGSCTVTLTETAASPGPEVSLKFDADDIDFRPEGIAIVPDQAGTESYYRLIGACQGATPITLTLKNAVAAAYDGD